MQKQIGCSGKSLSHHEHRRAVRPAGGSTGCQGLSAVFMGHVSHVAGGIAAYPGMGLYVQDGGLCLVEAQQEKPHMVLWAGLLDERQCGNLPACQTRQTSNLFFASIYNMPILYFLTIIFSALFVGNDFGGRTLQSYINAGHRRGKILFAKLVVHQIACMVILSFPLLLHSIIGTFVTKGALASIGIVVMVIASQFAMCLLPFFFAFIFRDIGKSMAVPMVLFFLMVFLMNGDQAQLISQILPMGQLRLMALQQSNISGGQFMFSDFLWVLALCLGTYLWFRRSDLK